MRDKPPLSVHPVLYFNLSEEQQRGFDRWLDKHNLERRKCRWCGCVWCIHPLWDAAHRRTAL